MKMQSNQSLKYKSSGVWSGWLVAHSNRIWLEWGEPTSVMPHSPLVYRTPQEFRQQFGCADVESKERFPHPHSRCGGDIVSTQKQNWESQL
jgi:hypothetical protein